MQVYICDVGLSPRALNSLMRGGLRTAEEIEAKTDKELLSFKGFGRNCLAEIHRLLPDRVRERKIKKPPRIRDKERFADIVQMRLDGQTVRGIAKKHGITYQRVHQILQQAGVKTSHTLPDEARN